MNISRTLVACIIAFGISLSSTNVVTAQVETEKSKEKESYCSQQYNKNRGQNYAAAGTMAFLGHLCVETLNKNPLLKDISAAQLTSPVLLGTSALLFCAAAVAPIAKYEPESDLFANKNAAHDHYFRTKFWALAGLAVAGGTITLDYILPYVYQMNIYDEILYKARNFFNRAI